MDQLEQENRPFLADQAWYQVMDHCASEPLQNEEKYVYRELQTFLLKCVSTKDVSDHPRLCAYLEKCHDLVEAKLIEAASYYSKLQWFWYLRRLPQVVFEGALSSTLPYDSGLAETLSAIAGRQEEIRQRETELLRYDINRSIMRRVLRFAYGIRFLSQIHSAFRRAGKSQPFEFKPGDALPQFDHSEAVEEAIRIYDDRMVARNTTLGRTGTNLTNLYVSETDSENSILLVYRLHDPRPFPCWIYDKEGHKQEVTVLARFRPSFETLPGLKELNERLGENLTGLWPPTILALVYLLKLATYLISTGSHSLSKSLEYGYIVTDQNHLNQLSVSVHASIEDFLKKVFPECTYPTGYESVEQQILEASGSIWPLKTGGIIRRDKGFTCIDLHGATNFLHAALELPKLAGSIANARSVHFEDTVQNTIARTPWKPQNALASVRQRQLKLKGNFITDIDAIASCESTLLLISCKSVVSAAEYDKGNYSVVRNAATTIVDAVSDWNEKITFFNENKKGDNYDFSPFQRIIGTTCTPTPIFVPVGIATKMALTGLRATVSLGELYAWLQPDSAA